MTTLLDVFLLYICPGIGCVLATCMFAAPVADLRHCLIRGDLGCLDPLPFCFAAGNTLGWIIYGYMLGDPFLVAANLPGFLVSLWLNYGAAKLQYLAQYESRQRRQLETSASHSEEHWDASPPLQDEEGEQLSSSNQYDDPELFVFSPQETNFFRMMVAWAVLATYASWLTDRQTGATLIGWAVNICLVFFYGSPLHTIRTVVQTQDSSPIHRPTLTMSFVNTSFWCLYGLARHNMVIVVPNATGWCLGVVQVLLCMRFPSSKPRGAHASTTGSVGVPASMDAMTPQRLAQQDVDDFD